MTTQNPAQDVSDAAIAQAFREYEEQVPGYSLASSWVLKRARELQQAQGFPAPTSLVEAAAQQCAAMTTQQAQVVGVNYSYAGDAAIAHGLDYNKFCAALRTYLSTTPQSSAPVVGVLAIIDGWMEGYDHWGTGGSETARMSEEAWAKDRAIIESALTGRGL